MEISVSPDRIEVADGGFAAAFFAAACPEGVSAERIPWQMYPGGPKCASCGAPIIGRRSLVTFWRGERTYCAGCGCKFSPRTGTILDGSHLSFRQFEIMVTCFDLGVDDKPIAALIHIHPDTVATWRAKIKAWESHV